MSRDEQLKGTYALMGEVISTCTEIEIELLYINIHLGEGANSVNQMWHRLSAFRQRIDFTDVLMELMCAKNETRKFWLSLRRALLELNSLRNLVAHGAVTDGPEDEDEQPRIFKMFEDRSAKTVSHDDMALVRDLNREALAVTRRFHDFLVTYEAESVLEKEFFRVADIRKRASGLKDKQSKLVPGERLARKLRERRRADPNGRAVDGGV